MADKNRGELRTAIRSVLREPVAARWLDTDINDYINNALEEVSRALLRTKKSTALVAKNAETVTLPTDCLILNELFWVDINNVITPIYRQFEDAIPTTAAVNDIGTPTKYWLIDNLIYLRSVPDTAGTVQFVYYYKLPELNSDTDVPALSGLNRFIKACGVYEAYFDDGDPRYELWEQRKNKELISWLGVESSTYATGFKQQENW